MKKHRAIKCLLTFLFIINLVPAFAIDPQENIAESYYSGMAKIKTANQMVKKAKESFNAESLDRAINYLKELLDSQAGLFIHSKISTYIELAGCYISKSLRLNNAIERTDCFYKAISYFNTALGMIRDNDLRNIKIYSGLGFAYLQLKDYNKASQFLKNALSYPTDNFLNELIQIYTNLGYSYFGLKKYDESISCFREALRLNPKGDPILPIYQGLSLCYRQIHDYDQAIIYLKKGLDYFLEAFRRAETKIYINFDLIAKLNNFQNEVSNLFSSITELPSQNYQTLLQCFKLVSFYKEVQANAQINPLEMELTPTFLVNPEDKKSDIFINAGYIALSLKFYEEAICYFNRSLELSPKDYQIMPIYLGLATCYRELLDFDQAGAYLMKGLNYFTDRVGLDYVIIGLKQYEESIKYLSQVLGLVTEDYLYVVLINCYNDFNKLVRARYLDNTLNYPLEIFRKERFAIYSSFGRIYLNLKQYEESLAYFNQALKLSPLDIPIFSIYLKIGALYGELKNYDKGIRCLDEGLNHSLAQ